MNIVQKFVDYLRSSKSELGKVTWPSRDTTIRYSALVILGSLGVAVFFGALDFGLERLLNATLANVQPTAAVDTAPVIPDVVPLNNDSSSTENPIQLEFTTSAPASTPSSDVPNL